jgi:hypothetical protein
MDNWKGEAKDDQVHALYIYWEYQIFAKSQLNAHFMDNIPLMFYLSHIIKKRNVISLSYCHSLVSVSVLITVLDIIIST